MRKNPTSIPFAQKKRIFSLWALSIAFLVLIAVSRPGIIGEQSSLDIALDIFASYLVVTGIFGRLWSILYLGGKKNGQLVTTGPFSMTRNPLYFFSLVAISGLGLTSGSLVIAMILTFCAACIFCYTALREARHLQHLFGSEYSSYARVTPLFVPKISLLRSPSEIAVNVRTLKSTLWDALFMLLMLPLMELFEYLRTQELIPTLFVFP